MPLKRVLSTVDASWIVAGSMIGVGIFLTPGVVAGHLPGAFWTLCAWLLGGILALCGAAVYGELGARIPEAGGDYQYLTHAYGPIWGFLNGWAAITLTFSAAAAAMVQGSLSYLAAAIPALDAQPTALRWIGAPLIVIALTWANTIGARVAGKATALFTAIPLAGLVVLFAFGMFSGRTETHWPEQPFAWPENAWYVALGTALISIFFTYSGWNAAAYLAGEMRSPGRGLARALLVGTGLVTLLYLSVNLVLLLVLPHDVLAGSDRPAAEAARQLLGLRGERILASMIALAVLGSANVTLMAGARIYYAMATDGMGPAAFRRTNRAGVPSTALWVGGLWTALLSVTGDISDLVGWATLAILLLSSTTVTTLFVFRRRDPSGTPFRCPGYPVTPILYLAVSLGAAVSAFLYDPTHAALGLGIIGLGFPLYFIVRRGFRSPSAGGAS